MNKQMKHIALALALILIMVTMAACGGDTSSTAAEPTPGADGTLEAESTDKLNVYVCATYVDEDGMEELKNAISQAVGDGVTVTYTTISTGSEEDPTMYMASLMKLTAALAAQEADIIIADDTNAARNARSEAFYALSEILTEDEITALGERALDYDIVDDEGNSTGETVGACGVDISGSDMAVNCVGNVSCGAFVACNAANFENAKIVLKAFAQSDAAE